MTKFIRLPDETYEQLTAYAKDTNRSIANAANHLLTKYLVEWPDLREHQVKPVVKKNLSTLCPRCGSVAQYGAPMMHSVDCPDRGKS